MRSWVWGTQVRRQRRGEGLGSQGECFEPYPRGSGSRPRPSGRLHVRKLPWMGVMCDVCRGGLCWAGAPETGRGMLQGKIQARGEGGLYKRGQEGSDGCKV